MHISLPEARTINIPLFNKDLYSRVRRLFEISIQKKQKSKAFYVEAEKLLMHELGLNSRDSSPEISYIANYSQAMNAHRLDAEYWNKKYTTLIDNIKKMKSYTLSDLTTFSNGATPRGADYMKSGIPFLRIQNIDENKLNLDDIVYIDEKTHNGLLMRSQLHPGDILITITGRIGTSAVVPEKLSVGNINQHIVRLRLRNDQINPYYLAVFLNSPAGRLQTEREAYGTTRDALPYYCLERIAIPLASQNLQKQIEYKIKEGEKQLQESKSLYEFVKRYVEDSIYCNL